MLRYGAMLVFGVGCAQVADIGDVTGPPVYSGTVSAAGTGGALSNAQVQLHDDTGLLITTATTDGSGQFAIALENLDLPFYGYLEVHDDAIGAFVTIDHLQAPTSDDLYEQITLYTESSLAAYATASGTTQIANTNLVVATIYDDTGTAVAGTTVTAMIGADPVGTVCYAKGDAQPHCGDASATQTDDSGVAWIFSAPADGAFIVQSASNAYLNFPLNADSVVFTPVTK